MKTKRAVVTGGAGFIGSHLVDALLSGGWTVDVIDNLSAGKREDVNGNATLHELDICDNTAIAPVIAGADTVFHLAALPRVPFSIDHPREAHDVNVNGTLNVFLAAKEGGLRRVVFASSGSVYGDQTSIPFVETMTPAPASPYGLHKLIGEEYARLFADIYGMETVSLRYFNVYGARMNPEGAYALAIGKFLKYKREEKPLPITGDGDQTRDFTHVRDVVRANMLAATSDKVGKGEAINIGAGRRVSVNKLASLFDHPTEHVPPRIEPRDAEADNRKAKELLNWEPTVRLEEGIGELVNRIW